MTTVGMVWIFSFFLLASFFQIVKACFKNSEFYCAKQWYFWFVLFWTCIFIIVAVIVITNLCTKKNRRINNKGSTQRKSHLNGQAPGSGQGVINVRERHGIFLSKSHTIPASTKEDQISPGEVTPNISNGKVSFTISQKGDPPNTNLADVVSPRSQPSAASITKVNPDELSLGSESDGSEESNSMDEASIDVKTKRGRIATKVSKIDEDLNDF